MATIIAVELFLIALFYFWPGQIQNNQAQLTFDTRDVTHIQAPVRTEQESSPPPPPTPQVPIPVPNDQPIKEEIKIPHDVFSNARDSLSVTPGTGGQGNDAISGNPEVGPRVIKIEEPTFEDKSPEKADIYVRFLVDKKGNVEKATIDQIFLYDGNGNPTKKVDTISNKKVLKQTIQAALNWKFHPAKDHGKPVRAYTREIFTVDY